MGAPCPFKRALECEEAGSIIAEEACIANSSHGYQSQIGNRSSKRVALEVPRKRPTGCSHRMVNTHREVAHQQDNAPEVALVQKEDKRWRMCIDPASINNPSQRGSVIVSSYKANSTRHKSQLSAANRLTKLLSASTWDIHRSYHARPESLLATQNWTNQVFNPLR